MAEIPGDYNDSDSIEVYNFFAAVGDSIHAEWLQVPDCPTTTITGNVFENYFIDFGAGAEVSTAKIVYEILK